MGRGHLLHSLQLFEATLGLACFGGLVAESADEGVDLGDASLLFLEQHLPGSETLTSAVVWTILLSVIAHGLSANPLSRLYGTRVTSRGGIT